MSVALNHPMPDDLLKFIAINEEETKTDAMLRAAKRE